MTMDLEMCDRVIQASGPQKYGLLEGLDLSDSRLHNFPRRWNGCPSQELLVIREDLMTGRRSLDPLKWGLTPHWCTDPRGGRRPINARAETVATFITFRDAYRRRRCILPVDGYYEWKAGRRGKQPYAIAMKDGSPFGIAAIWDNWKDPSSGQWVGTFAVLTTPPNELVARIHQRMPAILHPQDYDRWIGPEPDPHDLLTPFPAEPMIMWPVSSRVNSKQHDDAELLHKIELPPARLSRLAIG